MRSFFGELDPVLVCFLQLVGKQYPLKAVLHTKKKKEVEEEENYSLQTEPTREHKATANQPFYLLFPSFRPSRKYKVRISSHTRDMRYLQYLWFFVTGYGLKNSLRSDRR